MTEMQEQNARLIAPKVVCVDPGLAVAGWCKVLLEDQAAIVDCGVVVTESSVPRKPALPWQLDMTKRGQQLFDVLVEQLRDPTVVFYAVEIPLGAKTAASAWQMSRAHQSAHLASRAAAPHLAPMAVSAYLAKLATTGSKVPKDGKRAVAKGVRQILGRSNVARALERFPEDTHREAITDALAVNIAIRRTRQVRLLAKDFARLRA